MNNSALIVSLLAGITVLCVFMGISYLKKKEIKTSKFVPFYDYTEEEKHKRYEEILQKSKVPIKIALTLIVLGGIVIGIITYIVVGVLWIALLSFLGGFLIPSWWYKWHIESNKKVMLKQMEQASEVIAAVIKTGSSLPEAFERAAREIKEPLRSELVRTATQMRIGVPTSHAFLEFSQRVDIPEMTAVSIAIDLQETGMAINIPNLFSRLQSDIRHKVQFKRSVEAITSEIKLAGIIVSIVPFVTITIMRFAAPEFVGPLFDNAIGLTIFGLCVGLILFGVKWMFSIAKLEDV